MAAKDANNTMTAHSLSGLRVAENANPGWSAMRHLREPFFIKACLINLLFGIIVAILFFFFHQKKISFELKDFHVFSTYVLVFGGGLYLHGEFTPRRFILLLFAAAAAQIWLFNYWNNFPINLLNVPVGGWLIFWWIWSEPELMEKFGLRKSRIGRDLLVSASLSLVIMAYVIPVVMAFDFKVSVKIGALLTFAANVLPQNILNYSVMFSVWKRLDREGISQLGALAAIAAMVFAQQVFTWIELGINGVITPAMVAGGMAAIILLFVLAFGLTFRVFRNMLPAVFVMTTTQICMVMIGFMK